MKQQSVKGFTLLELLIVISIISILAAVLLPNLLAARKRTNQSVAQIFARKTATIIETKKESATGSMQALNGANCLDEGQGFAPKPTPIVSCSILAFTGGTDYKITLILDATMTGFNSMEYDSTTGKYIYLP